MAKTPTIRRMSDITSQRITALNSGTVETTVLTECLAVDFAQLMRNTLSFVSPQALHLLSEASKTGITARMTLAAQLLHTHPQTNLEELSKHASDTVRGWACYYIGLQDNMSLAEKLTLIRPLANDSHFGVREWSWLAMRKDIIAQPEETLSLLLPWTKDSSDKIRRFACEAIRPRGVWCAHFTLLKKQPELALPILDALRSDPSVYVQDSVANWLNDASKSSPDWVQTVCDRWLNECNTPATIRICKRALRTINK